MKYGRHGHKQSGPTVCGNRHYIRHDRLEAQLLEQIEARVFRAEILDGIVAQCEAELKRRRAELENGDSVKALQRERVKLERQAENPSVAIARGGPIQRLFERLREVEEELESVKGQIKLEQFQR